LWETFHAMCGSENSKALSSSTVSAESVSRVPMHSWSTMKKSMQKKLLKTLLVATWEASICQSSGVSAVDATRALKMTTEPKTEAEEAIVTVLIVAGLAILQETAENPGETVEGTVLRQGHNAEAGLTLTAGAEVEDAGHGPIAEEEILDATTIEGRVEVGQTVGVETEVEAEIEEIEKGGLIAEENLAVEENIKTKDQIVGVDQENQILEIEKEVIQEIENEVKAEANLKANKGNSHGVKKKVIQDHSNEVGVVKTIKGKGA